MSPGEKRALAMFLLLVFGFATKVSSRSTAPSNNEPSNLPATSCSQCAAGYALHDLFVCTETAQISPGRTALRATP
jgi:hypothetical protein